MRTGDYDGTGLRGRDYLPPGEPDLDATEDPDAAPLRDGPLWERVLRVAGAIVVTLYLALYAYDGLRQPRMIDSRHTRGSAYEQLLGDANEGRVARVDVRARAVRWQNRDGAVYQVNFGGIDFRGLVERQPYVREHPGSVTYGPIDRRVHGSINDNIAVWLLLLALLAPLARKAYPRHATRWGWVWTLWTLAGVPLYLLFSGSWVRTEPPPPADRERWRLGGGTSYLAMALIVVIGSNTAERLYESRHPIRPYDRQMIVRAERGDIVPVS